MSWASYDNNPFSRPYYYGINKFRRQPSNLVRYQRHPQTSGEWDQNTRTFKASPTSANVRRGHSRGVNNASYADSELRRMNEETDQIISSHESPAEQRRPGRITQTRDGGQRMSRARFEEEEIMESIQNLESRQRNTKDEEEILRGPRVREKNEVISRLDKLESLLEEMNRTESILLDVRQATDELKRLRQEQREMTTRIMRNRVGAMTEETRRGIEKEREDEINRALYLERERAKTPQEQSKLERDRRSARVQKTERLRQENEREELEMMKQKERMRKRQSRISEAPKTTQRQKKIGRPIKDLKNYFYSEAPRDFRRRQQETILSRKQKLEQQLDRSIKNSALERQFQRRENTRLREEVHRLQLQDMARQAELEEIRIRLGASHPVSPSKDHEEATTPAKVPSLIIPGFSAAPPWPQQQTETIPHQPEDLEGFSLLKTNDFEHHHPWMTLGLPMFYMQCLMIFEACRHLRFLKQASHQAPLIQPRICMHLMHTLVENLQFQVLKSSWSPFQTFPTRVFNGRSRDLFTTAKRRYTTMKRKYPNMCQATALQLSSK